MLFVVWTSCSGQEIMFLFFEKKKKKPDQKYKLLVEGTIRELLCANAS